MLKFISQLRSASGVVAVCILSLVAGLLYVIYSSLLPKPIPGIPYNEAATRSILGDIPVLVKDGRGLVEWLLDQSRRHNDPLCQIFLKPFGRPYVMVCDYREIHDIMLRSKVWDRSDFTIELLSTQAPHHHINQKTNHIWKAHRRLLQDLMLPGFLNRVVAPNIYASTLELVKMWEEKTRLGSGRPFSAETDIFYSSLDAVLEFTFGENFPHRAIPGQIQRVQALGSVELTEDNKGGIQFTVSPVHETIEATMHASVAMGELIDSPSPRWQWWLRKLLPVEAKRIKVRNDFIKEEVNKALQRLKSAGRRGDDSWTTSAVDMMLQRESIQAEREERRPVFWSPSIRDEILGFVIAGHDTTSSTILWGLKFLADNQDAQIQLHDALKKSHLASSMDHRMPSAQEIAQVQIPYLDAVIEEILRLSHSLPIHDRQAICDTELLGHRIPKGTIVLMLNCGPSFTEPAFNVEENLRSTSSQAAKKARGVPEWEPIGMNKFRPERWLKGGTDGREVFDTSAGPTLPFGLGIRGCYGRKLAYLKLRIVFTLLVWRFHLERCNSALSSYDAVETLTHKPKHCYVKLRKIEL